MVITFENHLNPERRSKFELTVELELSLTRKTLGFAVLFCLSFSKFQVSKLDFAVFYITAVCGC